MCLKGDLWAQPVSFQVAQYLCSYPVQIKKCIRLQVSEHFQEQTLTLLLIVNSYVTRGLVTQYLKEATKEG